MKTNSDSAPGAQERKDGLLVPAHFVPTPRTVSPQAQAFLSHVAPVGAMPLPSSRDDKSAWRAYTEAGNNGMIALTAQYARRYPGQVVTHQLSAAPLYEITPNNLSTRNDKRAILYVHGGGFVVGGGKAAIYPAMQMAGMAQTRTFSIDYRMAPDYPFPVPLEDTVEAYRFLLKTHKPQNIAIFGPSAGANLAPACILKARDLGLPLPAACAVHSSPSNAGDSGDTSYTNDTVDIVLKHRQNGLSELYANGHDVKDPLLSPSLADFSKGFPPTILTSGTRDLLLSGTVLLHRAMRRGGIKAELHVWEAMTHAPFFGAPEEQELYNEHINFMLGHMES
jgi:monoterpene epsilon-lactone hydrolase